eukprot:jgi/Galph1/3420/GphlegSOOS_G2095.1
MVLLHSVELENFKTYHPKVRIETRGCFTAVIGPNGCGKSNFMDALSFVLGCRAASAGGFDFSKIKEKEHKGRRYASVTVTFVLSADEARSLALWDYLSSTDNESNCFLTLSRLINNDGYSEYTIAQRKVSQEEYFVVLSKLGLRNNAQTFMVFQNQIENISFKSPKELTAMFEELSGSDELKAQYEDAKQKKQRLDEESASYFQQRKALSSERKRYKEQSAEAKHYRELEDRLSQVKSTKGLLHLYQMNKHSMELEREIHSLQEGIEKDKQEMSNTETDLQQQRVISANISKARITTQKQYDALLQRKESQHIQMATEETEKAEMRKQLENKKRNYDLLQIKIRNSETEIWRLKETLEDLTQALYSVEEEASRAQTECTLSLEDYETYQALKRESSANTSFLKQELETLLRQEQLLSQQKRSIEQKMTKATADEDAYRADIESISQQINRVKRKLEYLRQEKESKQSEKTQLAEQHASITEKRRHLEENLRLIQNELIESGAILHENDMQTRMEEAFAVMKRVFPGVKGKVRDLIYPVQTKYYAAFQVSFGNYLDAVVVDNSQTGAECISYLKQQRLGSMVFLPLADLRPKPLDEELRKLGGTCKLFVDVLNCQPQYTSAMRYVAGSMVVCESLEEARQVFADAKQKRKKGIKLCTLDGTIINKSGFMTGGYVDTEEFDKSAQRQRVEELKRQQTKILDELSQITASNVSRIEDKIEKLTHDMQTRQSQSDILEKELASLEQKNAKLLQELSSSLSAKVEDLRQQLEAKETQHLHITDRIRTLEQSLQEKQNQLFATFLTKFGLNDITSFEERYIKATEALSARKKELETQKTKINRRLDYENDSLTESKEKLRNLETEINSISTDIEQFMTQMQNKSDELQSTEQELEHLRLNLEQQSKSFEEENEKSRNLRKKYNALQEQVNQEEKQLGSKAEELSEVRLAISELLRSCILNEIGIPLKGLYLNNRPGGRMLTEEDNIQEQEICFLYALQCLNCSQLDFDSLSRRYRDCKTAEEFEKVFKDLEDNERQIQSELDKIAPNLRAGDKLQNLKVRIEEIVEKYETTRQEALEATRIFQKVREERRKRFLSCFNAVSANIDRVYKELTRSSVSQLGGTAYLALENYEEPYLYGIKYHAMPPSKRFRDMDQLSGGEKTLAALALIFAIQSYRPAPFVILDEVDAALDRDNLSKVARYILERSRMPSPQQQYIVISLKDSFYEMADSLIGIYRNIEQAVSGVLSLDLSSFGEVTEQ